MFFCWHFIHSSVSIFCTLFGRAVPLTDSLLQAGQSRASVVLPRCESGIQHYPAVGSPSTVYVRCTDPGATSVHIWRCPAPLVWNQQVRGCVENNGDFGAASAKLRALPDLVGVLETESGRVVDVPAVPTLYDNRQSQLVPSYYVGSNQLVNQGANLFQQARQGTDRCSQVVCFISLSLTSVITSGYEDTMWLPSRPHVGPRLGQAVDNSPSHRG